MTTSSSARCTSPGDAAVVRNDGPEQKRAEDGMDADGLGGQRRQEQRDEDHGQASLVEALDSIDARQGASDERPDDQKHERDVARR